MRRWLIVGATSRVVAGLIALAVPAWLDAQYFGQNRVRYDRYDTRVLSTRSFDIHYDAPVEFAARDVGRKAERWVTRLAPFFGIDSFAARKPLILYTNHPDFQQTRLLPEDPSEGTRAFADAIRSRIVMPLLGTGQETDHVLGHEIVHLMQFDLAASLPGGAQANLFALPLWWVEGQAEYLSLGRHDPLTAAWLRAALASDQLPTLVSLSTDPRLFPYRYGHAVWSFIGGRWGDHVIEPLFRASVVSGIGAVMQTVLGVSPDDFTALWHQSVHDAYAPVIATRTSPAASGRQIIRDDISPVTLAPAISPDGQMLAVLTPRPFFGVNLDLVSVATGRVLRTLAGPAREPHADALSFLYAAGAWSADSRKFAHIVSRRGDHELAIVDVRSGQRQRRIRLDGVQSISGVSWSSDGRTLAVAGTSFGQPDLWLYDLESNIQSRVTNDAFAELLPAWSPDGRMLAIATDNHDGSDLDALDFGPLRVALLDPASGRVRRAAGLDALDRTFPGARVSNPQWSSTGQTLYVVADGGGVSDVYAVGLRSGTITPVTQLSSGVYGITERSPALSVATETGTIVATIFNGQTYRTVALEAGAAPLGVSSATQAAGVLPPHDAAAPSAVDIGLLAPRDGLPGVFERTPTTRRYRPRWGVEGLQSPGAGISGGPFGATLGGGAGILFGDLLGRQRLSASIFAQGNVEDTGVQLVYLDQRSRWNLFATAGRTPIRGVSGSQSLQPVRIGTQTVDALVVSQANLRTVTHQGTVGLQYPFSRRRRLEVSVGAAQEARSGTVRSTAIVGGRVIGSAVEPFTGSSTTYGTGTMALVHDDIVPGITSAKAGGRWRAEIGQVRGDVQFTSALVDARRYFRLAPVTLAVRAIHFGRYGAGAETRLAPIFIGDPSLMRGYRADSFDGAECGFGAGCPALSRLAGSRVALAGVELRVPLYEFFARRGIPLPAIELAPFVDAGSAWNAGDRFRLALAQGTSRGVVASGGMAARINAGGLQFELSWARPWQRERGGVFSFGLIPAW
jgi:hypothetical protein